MKLIECPRDAMQGLSGFIPTQSKISYINQLLKVGFDTVDFGSFVSPRAVPQMKDTADVLEGLDLDSSDSKLLAIIANLRGAREALAIGGIDYLGFPLSLSETFQQRNTNKSIKQAMLELEQIQSICIKQSVQLVTYLSMGFGNPYQDPYNPGIALEAVASLHQMGIEIISLADTIGVSDPENITQLFQALIPEYPSVEFGAHLHSTPATASEKIIAAYNSGCRRFDGAVMGFGGCPLADNHLVGNIATETLIACLGNIGVGINLDTKAFQKCLQMAHGIFEQSD